MSKIWLLSNIKILKIKLSLKNRKKNIFSEILYDGEDIKNLSDLTRIKNIFNNLIVFLEQFEPIKNNLNIKLKINLSNNSGVFSYKPIDQMLNLYANNMYPSIKEALNHEFLHVLDYYNGKNNEPFSEIYYNINEKIKKNIHIAELQYCILKGKNINNPSEKTQCYNEKSKILIFDYNILKRSLEIYFNDLLNDINIEMLTISNSKSFTNFLNSVNILKGQYYLFVDQNGNYNEFDLNEYLKNKNKIFGDFNDLYSNIDFFEKRFNYINKKFGSTKNIENFLEIVDDVIKENFNIFINNGLSTIENIFKRPDLMNIHEVRNIYYTPTLNILNEKPNSLLLKQIIAAKKSNLVYYLFNASEKISYCGQKNKGNFLNLFVQLSFKNEKKVIFEQQPKLKGYEELSTDAEKAFVRFIKKKNEYIDYDPVLNIKNKKQKSITPKTNAPVVFSNHNKNPNTPKRDSVIQNIIKKQQLQKSTVQNQNIEVERNKKPKI